MVPQGPRDRAGVESIASFFHPLDLVGELEPALRPGGLVQYQLVVPEHAEAALTESLRLLSDAGQPSFLAVLKRFGPPTPGCCRSRCRAGRSPSTCRRGRRWAPLFRTLDRLVVKAGGRLYLAKDSRLSPETFDRMYDRADEFRKLRRELDPDGVLQSDLARRLHL